MAERALVSRKTINTIENAVFAPSTLLARAMAGALGAKVEAPFLLIDDD